MERARHNIYAMIHKALRLAMTETLPAVGRLDASDPQEVSEAIVRVRDLLRFCKAHVANEETFIHPAIEARRSGTSARVASEHIEHLASIASLDRAVESLARAPSASRDAAAFALYAELGRFVGENFVHMYEEETVRNRALWDAYTDEELLALERAIKAHHTPEEMTFVLRWMLPAMTPAERAGLVADCARWRRRRSWRAWLRSPRRTSTPMRSTSCPWRSRPDGIAQCRTSTKRARSDQRTAPAILDHVDRLPHAKAEAAASGLFDRKVRRALGKPPREEDEARFEVVGEIG
jgi:hypothetical protein